MSSKSSHLSLTMRALLVGAFVLTAAIAVFAQTSPAHAAETCANNGIIDMGKYWLYNNLWGASSGSGSQCITSGTQNGDNISWSTTYSWTGSANSVKTYDSSVLGWHWGWRNSNTGLPVALSSSTSVSTSWSFNLNQTTSGGQNVSYDLWLSGNPNLGNADPTDEIMIWLTKTGSVQPVGSQVGTVTLAGTTWQLWQGVANSWNVYSFVRTSNTSSASLNLRDFTGYLTQNRGLSTSKHLISVESGTEVFTGAGTLNTTSYSVSIGGTQQLTPTPTATTPPPTATPTRTPTPGGPTPTATPTRTPTPPTGGASCRVSYTITNQWTGGFGVNIAITNTGSSAINNWNLTFAFPNGQTITQLWNGSYSQSGSNVTITNVSYNGSIAAGQTLASSPGFNGSWNGTNNKPTAFSLNGSACTVA